MRVSREQLAARAAVIAAVGRQLRESWSPKAVGPAPANVARLARQLGPQGEYDPDGREPIVLEAHETMPEGMPGAERHAGREMKSLQQRLNELVPEERKILEAASASYPIEELDIDLILDQARALGELSETNEPHPLRHP